MIEELQAKFGIAGAAALSLGRNNLPRLTLTHAAGGSVEIYLHGSHITSWKNNKGEELLFLSRESLFAPGKPIRGGIPVCFPQFGNTGPLPQHGFVRTTGWSLAKTEKTDNGAVAAELLLTDTEATRQIWPHAFRAELRVDLREDSLAITFQVQNTGKEPFSFTTALHTYFGVADIRHASVHGLQGVTAIDTLRNRIQEVDSRPMIRFDRETDLIYSEASGRIRVCDETRNRTITIRKNDMHDVVVWNPWIEKAQKMPDFGNDEYQQMVCVETGVIITPVTLQSEQQWQGNTVMTLG